LIQKDLSLCSKDDKMKTHESEPFEIGKAIPLFKIMTKSLSIIIPIKYMPVIPRLLCYQYSVDDVTWWKRYVSPELYAPATKINPDYKKEAMRAMFFHTAPFRGK